MYLEHTFLMLFVVLILNMISCNQHFILFFHFCHFFQLFVHNVKMLIFCADHVKLGIRMWRRSAELSDLLMIFHIVLIFWTKSQLFFKTDLKKNCLIYWPTSDLEFHRFYTVNIFFVELCYDFVLLRWIFIISAAWNTDIAHNQRHNIWGCCFFNSKPFECPSNSTI